VVLVVDGNQLVGTIAFLFFNWRSMTNADISALRKIAADCRLPAMRRLHAIDRLAADANVYIVESRDDDRHHWDTRKFLSEYRPTGTRARRAVIRLLRQLPESPRRNDRLLFLRGEDLYKQGRVNLRERIFKLKPPGVESPDASGHPKSVADQQIAEALKRWQEENDGRNNGTSIDPNESQAAVGAQ
jgi:hypothetical protein